MAEDSKISLLHEITSYLLALILRTYKKDHFTDNN
jgi:hypothetical protein